MTRHRFRPQYFERLLAVLSSCVALVGCDGNSNGPPSTPATPRTVGVASCQASCLVFENGRPFRLSHVLPDSAGAAITLAKFVLRGEAGDRVELLLHLNGIRLSEDELKIPIIVEVFGLPQRFVLGDFQEPRMVYEFASAGTVSIRYALPRALGNVNLDSLALEQSVANATVLSASSHWVTEKPIVAEAASPTCTVNTSSFTACGISGSITPYVRNAIADYVGGIWTSADNNYASQIIDINFSKPVTNVTVTIADPDYAGNALNDITGGTTYSVLFAYDNMPGVQSQDRQTVGGSGTHFQLVPAVRDYVAYRDLTFTLVDTSTVKDSILITPTSGSRKPGQTVSFTAKAAKGGSLTIVSWAWQSSNRITSPPASCGTSKTCKLPIYESGTMTVLGSIANVGNSQATSSITVVPCPPLTDPDTRMTDLRFIKNMVDLQDQSTKSGFERGARVFYNPTTKGDTLIEWLNASNKPCNSYVEDLLTQPQPYVRSGLFADKFHFHSHPWGNKRLLGPQCHEPPGTYAKMGPSYGEDPVTHVVTGDFPTEALAGNVGYLTDPDGNIFRWGSLWESNATSASQYARQQDGNGKSSCVTKLK